MALEAKDVKPGDVVAYYYSLTNVMVYKGHVTEISEGPDPYVFFIVAYAKVPFMEGKRVGKRASQLVKP